MEWWSVELLIIFAGLLPRPSLSVSVTGICLNVMSLVYMLSFGLSGATSIHSTASKPGSKSGSVSNPGRGRRALHRPVSICNGNADASVVAS